MLLTTRPARAPRGRARRLRGASIGEDGGRCPSRCRRGWRAEDARRRDRSTIPGHDPPLMDRTAAACWSRFARGAWSLARPPARSLEGCVSPRCGGISCARASSAGRQDRRAAARIHRRYRSRRPSSRRRRRVGRQGSFPVARPCRGSPCGRQCKLPVPMAGAAFSRTKVCVHVRHCASIAAESAQRLVGRFIMHGPSRVLNYGCDVEKS